jgi:hypothetical protein
VRLEDGFAHVDYTRIVQLHSCPVFHYAISLL